MRALGTGMIFVYDVKRGGECAMHFVTWDFGIIAVTVDYMARQAPFFETMKRMHEKAGHQMVLKHHADDGDIWAVEIGAGNRALMVHALNLALDEVHGTENGGRNETHFNLN